jgi:hypothetical protein
MLSFITPNYEVSMKGFAASLLCFVLLCTACTPKEQLTERRKGEFNYPTAKEIYEDCKQVVENYDEHRFLRSQCGTMMNGIYSGAFVSLYTLGQETYEMPYEVNPATGNVLESEYNTKAKNHNDNLKNDLYVQRFNNVFSCENGLPLDLMLEKHIERIEQNGAERKPLEYYVATLWLKTIGKKCESNMGMNLPNACETNAMSMSDKGSIFVSVSKSLCTK